MFRKGLSGGVALVALLTAAMAVASPARSGATVGESCETSTWGSLPKEAPTQVQGYERTGTVVTARAAGHECYDRLVVDLNGDRPGYHVSYVDEVVEVDTENTVQLRGGAFLSIVFESAGSAQSAEAVSTLDYRTFEQIAIAATFEGRTQMGLGVRARLPFRAFTLTGPDNGSRLVIDVAHTWPQQPETALPGEPYTSMPFGPGASFGVVGVAFDDVLNVRAMPGADQKILSTLKPLTTDVMFTGRARLLTSPTAVWYEVDSEGVTGWVHSRFVAPLAGTSDVTHEVIAAAGNIPSGSTVDDIGARVAAIRSRSGDDPPPRIVIVDRSSEEITYDLLGFYDDSVLGERLHVFIHEGNPGSGDFSLKGVEATWICVRGGGSGEGYCV